MLLQQNNRKCICFMFFLLIISNAYATDSICDTDEDVLFSCTMQNGKQLSICGVKKENQLLINYKYGKPKKIELIFPQNAQDNNDLFKYNHYFRYQTDYFRIVFVNNGYEYEIYRNYDGENSNEVTAGVNVSNLLSAKTYNNQCKTLQTDRINQLSDLLDCDNDNALGCEFNKSN
ncbi:hypothetical protein [Entomomonas asaccharolytica]|uniref:Secreted protein n=1 Tax=Entomomonas asaccharolytica TaxID=2785331 RepID=A0A974NHI5_9GAMM|nr:hypothetical protein [Entomomonas asaccharolytica]QQP86492.1 hypothetical protein JHT90_04425 [Entomomonas asaccharolytica]